MALTSGFFNSLNGDRRYTAEQFGQLFDGLITDGIYQAVGNKFAVEIVSGRTLSVDTGRAWFDGIWIHNDAKIPVTVADSEPLLNRIDAIVLEINKEEEGRTATIKMVQGTADYVADKPMLRSTDTVNQYPLAYIEVNAGTTTIEEDNIDVVIGSDECPWAGLVNQDAWIAAEELLFNAMYNAKSSGFDTMQAQKKSSFESMQNTKSSGFDTMQTQKQTAFDTWFQGAKDETEPLLCVPLTRKVNNKKLDEDITLNASDVGALASDGTATKATADANGNNIVDTYKTKSESANVAITTGSSDVPTDTSVLWVYPS